MSEESKSDPGSGQLLQLLAEREELLARLARETARERAESLEFVNRFRDTIAEKDRALEKLAAGASASDAQLRSAQESIRELTGRLDTAETRLLEEQQKSDGIRASFDSELKNRDSEILRLSRELAGEAAARQQIEKEFSAARDDWRSSEQRLHQETVNAQSELRLLRERSAALTAERDGFAARLEAGQERTGALGRELDELREKARSLENSLAGSHAAAETERTRLNGQIDTLHRERETLGQNVQRLERETARLEALLREAHERLAERERGLAQLARSAAAERMEATRRLDAAAASALESAQRITSLESRLEAAVQEARVQMARAERTALDLKSEQEARASDAARFHEELRTLDRQIADLREHRAREQERLVSAEALAAQFREEAGRARSEASLEAARQQETLLAEQGEHARRMAALDSRLVSLEAERMSVASRAAAAETEAEGLRRQLAGLQDVFQQIRSDSAAASGQNQQTIQQAIQNWESVSAAAGAQSGKLAQTVSELESRLSEIARRHDERRDEILKLENLLAEREKILADIVGGQSEEVRRYESQLEEARSRIRSLEAAVTASGGSLPAALAASDSAGSIQDELARLRAETHGLSKSLDAAVRKAIAESGRSPELAGQLARIETKLSALNAEDRDRRFAELLQAAQADARQVQEQVRTELRNLLQKISGSPQGPKDPLRLDPADLKRIQTDIDQRLTRSERQVNDLAAAFENFIRQPQTTPNSGALAKTIEAVRTETRASTELLRREIAAIAAQTPGTAAAKTADLKLATQLAALEKRLPLPGTRMAGTDRAIAATIAAAGFLLIVFGLAGVAWRQWRLENRLLTSYQPELFSGRSAASALEAPELDTPLPYETDGDQAEISGRASQAQGVVMHIDGVFFAAVPVRGGKFLVDRIPLEPGSHRVELWAFTPGQGFSPPVSGDFVRRQSAEAARITEPPRTVLTGLNVERGPTDRREIGLTFDGDGAAGAEVVMDTLRQKRIQTTVFLTGKFIDENPALVRRIVQDGHEVGNHTDTHPHLTTFNENNRHDTRPEVNKAWFQDELVRTSAKFEEVTGKPMSHIWRAPYGEVNAEILRWAHELGYRHVGWTRDYTRSLTLDSLDWVINHRDKNYQPGGKIVDRLLSFERNSRDGVNGGIVLMHLGTQRQLDDSVALHLPRLIDEWRDRGYRFVKVSTWLPEES